jgi:hypothetical protein
MRCTAFESFTDFLKAAMDTTGYLLISNELLYWITFLTKTLPSGQVGIFVGWWLVLASLLTSSGYVTALNQLLPVDGKINLNKTG